jgi:hypothetical protein
VRGVSPEWSPRWLASAIGTTRTGGFENHGTHARCAFKA